MCAELFVDAPVEMNTEEYSAYDGHEEKPSDKKPDEIYDPTNDGGNPRAYVRRTPPAQTRCRRILGSFALRTDASREKMADKGKTKRSGRSILAASLTSGGGV